MLNIKYFLNPVSKSFYKQTYFAITNNIFISDNLWLLEDNNEESYNKISEVKLKL